MLRKKLFLAVVFVIVLGLCLPSNAFAAGGTRVYNRWLLAGSPVYSDPDVDLADVVTTVEKTVAVTVTVPCPGWGEVVTPTEYAGFVQVQHLLKEEPAESVVAREQATLDATPVGSLTWAQLRELLMGLGYTPAATATGIGATSTATGTGTTVVQMIATDDMVWVRNDASSSATLVRKLPRGTIVTVFEEKIVNGVTWVRIGDNEWMTTTYLSPYGATVATTTGTTVSSTVDLTPLYATKLVVGASVIPNWGYGPWAKPGVVYPKVLPNGQIPLGASQPVTDFSGRNWQDHGSWSFTLPVGVKEAWITVQGDAPGQVSWSGNTLTLSTSAEITAKAKPALDNAPMPTAGSTGISVVVYVK